MMSLSSHVRYATDSTGTVSQYLPGHINPGGVGVGENIKLKVSRKKSGNMLHRVHVSITLVLLVVSTVSLAVAVVTWTQRCSSVLQSLCVPGDELEIPGVVRDDGPDPGAESGGPQALAQNSTNTDAPSLGADTGVCICTILDQASRGNPSGSGERPGHSPTKQVTGNEPQPRTQTLVSATTDNHVTRVDHTRDFAPTSEGSSEITEGDTSPIAWVKASTSPPTSDLSTGTRGDVPTTADATAGTVASEQGSKGTPQPGVARHTAPGATELPTTVESTSDHPGLEQEPKSTQSSNEHHPSSTEATRSCDCGPPEPMTNGLAHSCTSYLVDENVEHLTEARGADVTSVPEGLSGSGFTCPCSTPQSVDEVGNSSSVADTSQCDGQGWDAFVSISEADVQYCNNVQSEVSTTCRARGDCAYPPSQRVYHNFVHYIGGCEAARINNTVTLTVPSVYRGRGWGDCCPVSIDPVTITVPSQTTHVVLDRVQDAGGFPFVITRVVFLSCGGCREIKHHVVYGGPAPWRTSEVWGYYRWARAQW